MQQREERVERAVVAPPVHRQRVAQQDHVGLPGAHLDAGAERRRAGVRMEPAGGVVVRQKRGVEAGPPVPPEVGLGVEPAHERAADVVGNIAVAVHVEHDDVRARPRERGHRTMPEEPGANEQHQSRDRRQQQSQLAAHGRPARPDAAPRQAPPEHPPEPPGDVQHRAAGKEPVQPGHAEHRDAIPEREERRERQVQRRIGQMQGWRERRSERIAERAVRPRRARRAGRRSARAAREVRAGPDAGTTGARSECCRIYRTIRAQAPRESTPHERLRTTSRTRSSPPATAPWRPGPPSFVPTAGRSTRSASTPAVASHQEYVEDCQVCCRPWRVEVTYLPDGTAEVSVEAGVTD